MSQMTPEAPPAQVPPSRDSGSGGNPLKRKIGPLPTWAWVLILAAVLLGWAYYRNRTSSAAASSADTGDTTDASQVPQFVNQTFTSVSPPAAPNPVPGAAPTPATVPGGVGTKTLTVPRNMTLKQFAKQHHWTDITLAAVEAMNNLHPGAKLHKGQKIKRPWAPAQVGQPGAV